MFTSVRATKGGVGGLCQSRQAVDVQRSRLTDEQNLLCSRLLPSEQTRYSNTCTPLSLHWQPLRRESPRLCLPQMMITFTLVMQLSSGEGCDGKLHLHMINYRNESCFFQVLNDSCCPRAVHVPGPTRGPTPA